MDIYVWFCWVSAALWSGTSCHLDCCRRLLPGLRAACHIVPACLGLPICTWITYIAYITLDYLDAMGFLEHHNLHTGFCLLPASFCLRSAGLCLPACWEGHTCYTIYQPLSSACLVRIFLYTLPYLACWFCVSGLVSGYRCLDADHCYTMPGLLTCLPAPNYTWVLLPALDYTIYRSAGFVLLLLNAIPAVRFLPACLHLDYATACLLPQIACLLPWSAIPGAPFSAWRLYALFSAGLGLPAADYTTVACHGLLGPATCLEPFLDGF